ncbi:MAG TPA: bifunctional phosphopantothenoylcysteine decarboxylase/phosphopantothenate--cysteine ligase CoaBC [Acidimicrobiales bacterium]|nr:bifunctional phosphopantothenoylcysteine decarboxylase/phosphopantothenate--cysteine ligase CoaBC [Acidimicrobiales bacterium]
MPGGDRAPRRVAASGERADVAVGPDGAGGPVPAGTPVVVLGVTGGIAAYKAVEVCRRLVDAGVHVVPVLTEDATRFVGEVTFSALASEPVRRSLWHEADPIPHTHLGQRADLVVVVPATARFLGTYAAGIADGLLTATVLATRAPVLVCPAMHTEMWEHPAVQENLATLERRGVHVVAPAEGRLAGGDTGAGRLAEPGEIVARALALVGGGPGGDLHGRTVLVTAGGTREAIDPVRFITNRSSGKQGHAIADAAARRGASVVLVTTTSVPGPPGAAVVRVDSAAQMEEAVVARAAEADVIVMAAAVADFRPKAVADRKLSKADGLPEIVLEPTADILAEVVRRRRPGQVLVGFAAETHDVVEHAAAKLAAKGVDVIVANDVAAPGVGFDHDTNAVTILEAGGARRDVPLAPKGVVADAVLDTVAARLQADPSSAPEGSQQRSRS